VSVETGQVPRLPEVWDKWHHQLIGSLPFEFRQTVIQGFGKSGREQGGLVLDVAGGNRRQVPGRPDLGGEAEQEHATDEGAAEADHFF